MSLFLGIACKIKLVLLKFLEIILYRIEFKIQKVFNEIII